MIAALSLMLILVISFSLTRIAAVAMRLTGLPEAQARFQALSALTGTGFTTSEAELIVNYPVRRKIVTFLMIIGNLGFISVVSTLMVSFMRTEADFEAICTQVAWIIGGIILLWIIMTNKTADGIISNIISFLLKKYTFLGKRSYTRLLQIGDGLSIAEHHLANGEEHTISETLASFPNLQMLSVRKRDGKTLSCLDADHVLDVGDAMIIMGNDEDHNALASTRQDSLPASA